MAIKIALLGLLVGFAIRGFLDWICELRDYLLDLAEE